MSHQFVCPFHGLVEAKEDGSCPKENCVVRRSVSEMEFPSHISETSKKQKTKNTEEPPSE